VEKLKITAPYCAYMQYIGMDFHTVSWQGSYIIYVETFYKIPSLGRVICRSGTNIQYGKFAEGISISGTFMQYLERSETASTTSTQYIHWPQAY
jgi:hypothetical protein